MIGRDHAVRSACLAFSISPQAYYKSLARRKVSVNRDLKLVELVKSKRRLLPNCGGRKLLHMIGREGHERIGRDRFFRLLSHHNLLVRRRKRYARTTDSNHFYRVHQNLLKAKIVTRPNQALVSDITYMRLTDRFAYLSLVTDAYSRKILGFDLRTTLAVEGAIAAASMAINHLPSPKNVIHHSDRGIQYCCNAYTELLRSKGMQISMAEAGNPYENAIAERVNGILKTEFCLDHSFNNLTEAKKAVKQAVNHYNKIRPHQSLHYATPSELHEMGFQQINKFEQKKKEAKKKKLIINQQ